MNDLGLEKVHGSQPGQTKGQVVVRFPGRGSVYEQP